MGSVPPVPHLARGSTAPWGPAPGTWCRAGSAGGPVAGNMLQVLHCSTASCCLHTAPCKATISHPAANTNPRKHSPAPSSATPNHPPSYTHTCMSGAGRPLPSCAVRSVTSPSGLNSNIRALATTDSTSCSVPLSAQPGREGTGICSTSHTASLPLEQHTYAILQSCQQALCRMCNLWHAEARGAAPRSIRARLEAIPASDIIPHRIS